MMPKGQITGSSFCYAPFGPVLLYTHTHFAFLPAAKWQQVILPPVNTLNQIFIYQGKSQLSHWKFL